MWIMWGCQVDADPSSRKRVAALRSEHDIARMTGRSNIVSKACHPHQIFPWEHYPRSDTPSKHMSRPCGAAKL